MFISIVLSGFRSQHHESILSKVLVKGKSRADVQSLHYAKAYSIGEVSLVTKEPISDFILNGNFSDMSGGWFGILPKRETLHNELEESAYDRELIGTGVMRLTKHVPSDVMTFERFADYYYQPPNGLPTDKRVKFAEFDLRLIPEEVTRVAALRSGGADIAPVSLAARNQVEAGGGQLVFGWEGVYFYIRQLGCWPPVSMPR